MATFVVEVLINILIVFYQLYCLAFYKVLTLENDIAHLKGVQNIFFTVAEKFWSLLEIHMS